MCRIYIIILDFFQFLLKMVISYFQKVVNIICSFITKNITYSLNTHSIHIVIAANVT